MAADCWLPIGYALPEGARLVSAVDNGADWQLVETSSQGRALIVREALLERWIASRLLDQGSAMRFGFGPQRLAAIASGPRHALGPVARCRSPASKSEAMAFASAMKATRAIDPDSDLQSGIYVEKLSCILPTYGADTATPDDTVLGGWLTSGLHISVLPVRSFHRRLSWLSLEHLTDVVRAAGFDVDELVAPGPGQRAGGDRPPDGKPESRERSGLDSGRRFELPGRKALETFFNEHVIDIVQNQERYRALGIGFPPAMVLEGPPGCGKTHAVQQLVAFLDWPLYSIDAGTIGSPYIHETSRKVADIFEQAITGTPSVIVIDEMEAFLADRDMGSGSSHHRVEEVAEFLRRIPQAVERGVLIIGMTNRIAMIDPAVLRRGRFDQIVKVDYAGEDDVRELLDKLLASIPKADDVDVAALAGKLAGRPLSDVTYVLREGARLAARERKPCLDAACLAAALASAPARDPDAARRIGFR